jgi:hypothetical protein
MTRAGSPTRVLGPSHSVAQVDGGQAINRAWCSSNNATSLQDAQQAYVLYVGATPVFDSCLHGICISRQPSSYLDGGLLSGVPCCHPSDQHLH